MYGVLLIEGESHVSDHEVTRSYTILTYASMHLAYVFLIFKLGEFLEIFFVWMPVCVYISLGSESIRAVFFSILTSQRLIQLVQSVQNHMPYVSRSYSKVCGDYCGDLLGDMRVLEDCSLELKCFYSKMLRRYYINL